LYNQIAPHTFLASQMISSQFRLFVPYDTGAKLATNGNVGEVPSKAGVSSLRPHRVGAGEAIDKFVMASNLHNVSSRHFFGVAIIIPILHRTLLVAAIV